MFLLYKKNVFCNIATFANLGKSNHSLSPPSSSSTTQSAFIKRKKSPLRGRRKNNNNNNSSTNNGYTSAMPPPRVQASLFVEDDTKMDYTSVVPMGRLQRTFVVNRKTAAAAFQPTATSTSATPLASLSSLGLQHASTTSFTFSPPNPNNYAQDTAPFLSNIASNIDNNNDSNNENNDQKKAEKSDQVCKNN